MAVSGTENYATLGNLHYQVYSDKGVQQVIPDAALLQKRWKNAYKTPKQFGQYFNRAVRMVQPQGFTFAPAGAGSFDTNPAIAGKYENAQIQGQNVLGVEILGYEDAARAVKGKTAYLNATKAVMDALISQAKLIQEANFMFGQSGLTKVNSTGTTGTTVTLQTAEFPDQVFIGQENMPIEIFDSTGATRRIATTITSVDPVGVGNGPTFKVADTITGLLSNGDIVWRAGSKPAIAATYNEAVGLQAITGNTGTLFGIDGSVATGYALWRPYTKGSLAGAFSFLIAQLLAAQVGMRGAGRALSFIIHPNTFIDILQNAEALRRLGDKDGKAGSIEIGAEDITFYSPAGKLSFLSHGMQKRGYAFLLDDSPDIWEIVGNMEWTFRMPGSNNIWMDLPYNAGSQIRLMRNAALFCTKLAANSQVTGIVNTQVP